MKILRGKGRPERRQKPDDMVSVGKGGTRLSSGGLKERHNAQLKAAAGAASAAKPGAPRPEQKPELKIEERVLAQKWAKAISFPLLYREFAEKIAPRITLPETTLSLLQVFSNADDRAEKVVRVLRANPYYQAQFLRHVESARGDREDAPGVDSAIVLLGMENSRNLVVALQLARTVLGKHADWDRNGKLELNPNDTLKFAIRTEEALAPRKDAFASTAFAAGLVFDYLSAIARRYCDDVKKAAAVIDQVYAHGMKAARVGMILSEGVPDFILKKYVFMGCLVHDVGKAAMAVLEPRYLDFWDEARKRGLPRAVRQFAEDRRFGVPHPLIGAMVCRHFSALEPVEAAVLHHHAPFMLQSANRNVHLLSTLISLSSNIASQLKNPDGLKDPVFASWLGPEIRGLNVPRELMAQAATATLKDKD